MFKQGDLVEVLDNSNEVFIDWFSEKGLNSSGTSGKKAAIDNTYQKLWRYNTLPNNVITDLPKKHWLVYKVVYKYAIGTKTPNLLETPKAGKKFMCHFLIHQETGECYCTFDENELKLIKETNFTETEILKHLDKNIFYKNNKEK